MKPTPPGFGPSFEGATQTSSESTWPRQKSPAASGLLKDRYRFGKELDRGAIGVVYLAYDERLHSRPVVIKVLQEIPESQEWVRKKFRQEIEALSRVNHPGIVGVLDAGEMPDGKVLLVIPLSKGYLS
ncbi:MAG: protein kinase [Blastocatellia bacterium]